MDAVTEIFTNWWASVIYWFGFLGNIFWVMLIIFGIVCIIGIPIKFFQWVTSAKKENDNK